jgi:hypothetical protein
LTRQKRRITIHPKNKFCDVMIQWRLAQKLGRAHRRADQRNCRRILTKLDHTFAARHSLTPQPSVAVAIFLRPCRGIWPGMGHLTLDQLEPAIAT